MKKILKAIEKEYDFLKAGKYILKKINNNYYVCYNGFPIVKLDTRNHVIIVENFGANCFSIERTIKHCIKHFKDYTLVDKTYGGIYSNTSVIKMTEDEYLKRYKANVI